ncbi:hypothetical protein CfE428DRAFT_2057 [Chthoniobacter flavus Ellin428]|uniref:Tetratricopeptide repeat protein n=1 Tax=Chthoniobacter flavus Ellin428 TaxID=497964 RepID=B4CZG9_9BACT|nr:hypothetical protein [Chthoniobacter flavus]EDY20133.1 hypothetical protein CfE428DRAFT_2057 [Chthoniobacter flavus Ellin428]TCO94032.1 hypothetical protein EV701_103118 [Chthoniobacter flavus]
METPEKASQQFRETVQTCFAQMRVARAAELARSRRYREAEDLLTGHEGNPSDPRELDLLARIAAQQRQYPRARHLWEVALQRLPGQAEYERAIVRTRRAERLQTIGRIVALLVVVALVVAGFNPWIRSRVGEIRAQIKILGGQRPPAPAP